MEAKIAGFGNVDLHWHVVDREIFNDLPTRRHLNTTIYLRLVMEDILPAGLDRVVFLDGDLVVEGDLAKLYDQDPEDAILMAVCDYGGTTIREELPIPGIEPTAKKSLPYFNAGVLLINLEGWREQRIGKIALDYVREFRPRYFDQDALNAVLVSKWRPLDLAWNAQVDELITPDAILHSAPWNGKFAGEDWNCFTTPTFSIMPGEESRGIRGG